MFLSGCEPETLLINILAGTQAVMSASDDLARFWRTCVMDNPTTALPRPGSQLRYE